MIHFVYQSPLEKIDINDPQYKKPYTFTYALRDEYLAYQLIVYSDKEKGETVSYEVISPNFTKLYKVKQVDVRWPHYAEDKKTDYLIDSPDTLSDILEPINYTGTLRVNKTPLVLWVEIAFGFEGDYVHNIRFVSEYKSEWLSEFNVRVLPQKLETRKLNHIQYIDPSSIAYSYNVPLYSSVFWELLYDHMRIAHDHGVNGIVLPIFPVFYESTMPFNRIQLIDVIEEATNKYEFNYELLDSWLVCMRDCGIENIVIPPIFPSFVHRRCPPIVAKKGRDVKLVFDQNTSYDSPEYLKFIRRFIRCFLEHLKEFGFRGEIEFQISSNSMSFDHKAYCDLKEKINGVIERHIVADAMPTWEFYSKGSSSCPTFWFHDLKNYYEGDVMRRHVCFDILKADDAVNQLIATSSARLRSLGMFSYMYGITGWFGLGFNYCFSLDGSAVDLTKETDNGRSYPSGSCHLVYPSMKGPVASIRLHQLRYAMQDYSLLRNTEGEKIASYKRIENLLISSFNITPESIEITSEKYLSFKNKLYKLYENKAKRKEEIK